MATTTTTSITAGAEQPKRAQATAAAASAAQRGGWREWARQNRRWLFVMFCVILGLGGVLAVVLLSAFFH